MTMFRAYLVLALICLTIYTLMVGNTHGWNLLPLFFAAIGELSWQGQFNFDFMWMLSLSALWTAWRHHFSPVGLALAVVAFFGGMSFLSIYLLWAATRCDGDMAKVLLGETRARR